MSYPYILAIDPSGNFEEGKGTTGSCLFDVKNNCVKCFNDIHASEFTTKEAYWQYHLNYIETMSELYPGLVLVIEDFTLDPRRAMQQSHSRMETPKLIGILQLFCQQKGLPYKMQRAVEVKNRWADPILEYKQYIIRKNRMHYLPALNMPLSRHSKDAVRHAVHFATFYNKEDL